jgi:hypothetical protein
MPIANHVNKAYIISKKTHYIILNNEKPKTLSDWGKEVFKLYYQQSQHFRNFSSDLNKKLNYTATDAV